MPPRRRAGRAGEGAADERRAIERAAIGRRRYRVLGPVIGRGELRPVNVEARAALVGHLVFSTSYGYVAGLMLARSRSAAEAGVEGVGGGDLVRSKLEVEDVDVLGDAEQSAVPRCARRCVVD